MEAVGASSADRGRGAVPGGTDGGGAVRVNLPVREKGAALPVTPALPSVEGLDLFASSGVPRNSCARPSYRVARFFEPGRGSR